MKKCDFSYKRTKITCFNDSFRIIELNFVRNFIFSNKDCVIKVTELTEFTGYSSVDYVILNMKESSYTITNTILSFLENVIMSQLLEYGVRKIFFLVSSHNKPVLSLDDEDVLISSDYNSIWKEIQHQAGHEIQHIQ